MALEDVLAQINYDTALMSAAEAEVFKHQCDAIIAEAYLGSPVAAAMYDRLVDENRILKIKYAPGALRYDGVTDAVLFDFSAPDDIILIDKDGTLFQATDRRMLIHETIHAVTGEYDNQNGELPIASGFDFTGFVVTKTNLIEEQLGADDHRLSYWGNFSLSSPEEYNEHQGGYTEGQQIDIAFTATPGSEFAFIDTSTQSGPTRDLLIGLNNDINFYSGDGNDWLYGGNGNNELDAGADDDHVFGEGGDDSVIGGSGNDYLDGGDHNEGDLLTYEYVETGVRISVETPASGGDAAVYSAESRDSAWTDSFTNFEELTLTEHDDHIEIHEGMDGMKIIGGGGNDTLDLSGLTDGMDIDLNAIRDGTMLEIDGGSIWVEGFEVVIGTICPQSGVEGSAREGYGFIERMAA